MSEKQKIYDIINSILKDNQCIREDTLTHKLFDWLGDVKDEAVHQHLTDNNGLWMNISKLVQTCGEDFTPKQYVFALRITAVLLTHVFAERSDPPRITEADIISSNVWHLAHYHEGSREGLWSDASVRDQWLRSIRIYYKSAAGLNIFMENGYCTKVISSLTDSSLYVRETAVQTAMDLLICCCPTYIDFYKTVARMKIVSATEDFDKPQHQLCNVIRAIIEPMISSTSQKTTFNIHDQQKQEATTCLLVQMSLRMLDVMAATTELRPVVQTVMEEHDVVQMLQKHIERFDKKIIGVVVAFVKTVYNVKLDPYLNKYNLMSKLPLQLLNADQQNSSLLLAVLLYKCEKSSELLQLANFPIVLLLEQAPSRCSADVNAKLGGAEQMPWFHNKKAFLQLFTTTLQFLTEQDDPCDFITMADLSLLLQCSVRPSPDQRVHETLARHLTASNNASVPFKIIKAIINLLKASNFCEKDATLWLSQHQDLFSLLNDIILSPDSSVQLITESFNAITILLSVLRSPLTQHVDTTQVDKLMTTVTRRLNDMRWEVRDSTLEFVANLYQDVKEDSVLCVTAVSCNLCQHVWMSLEDSESYVRASAIKALQPLMIIDSVHKELENRYGQVIIRDKLQSVIRHDSEVFPRRACVELLQNLLEHGKIPPGELTSIFVPCVNDLDVTVKNSLQSYWFKETQQIVQIASETGDLDRQVTVTKLYDSYCMQSLLHFVLDYDYAVQIQAVSNLRKLLNILSLTLSELCDVVRDIIYEKKQQQTKRCDEIVLDLDVIAGLDLKQLESRASQSADLHVRNPTSLLNDILVDLENKIVHSDGEDEMIADCY